MKGNGGFIETNGRTVIDIEDGIQIDHMIIIHLVREEKGAGVLTLLQGNHIELILFLLNAEKVHHIEEGSHHVVVLAPQVITEELICLKLMMRAN